eukprot:CAMPEP_0178378664 /NCGR_PEP_ID=MMETSP0689_2-20121128/4545_1 /TAXON_ID=160604 /ORGANISM="Amphidinium massartii, Strain CS-259" /LENGTH=93 /DNA_ID=CAMNT_0019998745 /DNA_START=1258 /DNA_END=1539 /DNA_ORIENTATION=+
MASCIDSSSPKVSHNVLVSVSCCVSTVAISLWAASTEAFARLCVICDTEGSATWTCAPQAWQPYTLVPHGMLDMDPHLEHLILVPLAVTSTSL